MALPGMDATAISINKNFGTDFPQFKKIDVNGETADPELLLFMILHSSIGLGIPLAMLILFLNQKKDPDEKLCPIIIWDRAFVLKRKKDFAGGSGFGYDYKKETLRRLT